MMSAYQYDHNNLASSYKSYEEIPFDALEAELMSTVMGSMENLTVLDIGGGTGRYAFKAIDAGARQVVDMSSKMLTEGQKAAAQLGLERELSWIIGDARKHDFGSPEARTLLAEYDVVMCNYLFDHAENEEDLHAMFRTIVARLKRGGKLINIRVHDHLYHYMVGEKYGNTLSHCSEIPGGLKYTVHFSSFKQPFSIDCHSMWQTLNLSNEVNEKHGLSTLQCLPMEEMQIVKQSPEYWKDMVEAPLIAVCTAVKL